MTCPPTGNEAGLVGYWNFEEGSGTTAYDQTSNGNNGTINGATYDTNVPSQSCALTNANGCDSTAILNLTINPSTTSISQKQLAILILGMDRHIRQVEFTLLQQQILMVVILQQHLT